MPTAETIVETRCLSSLAKVLYERELSDPPYRRATALQNETFAFQVAYRLAAGPGLRNALVRVRSPLAAQIGLRAVGLAPSELPCYPDHDDDIVSEEPGLYPDPLLPLDAAVGVIVPPGRRWRSIWVTVSLDGTATPGSHPIRLVFAAPDGGVLAEETFALEVVPAALPVQKLICTHWLHADCLATAYDVEVFGDAHWRLIRQYVAAAVRHGNNMMLTPLFTPPLDTQVGGERPTVQLVDVAVEEAGYRFDFGRLLRWIRLCDEESVRYFEFSHLFTQWGAKHAPKIMAAENGVLKRIFGWDTDAAAAPYRRFLGQFLPALVRFLADHGLEARCFFHLSDEPALDHLPWYRSASEIMREHAGRFPIIDALSDYEFYEQGQVHIPVAAIDRAGPFLERGVSPLWAYYCCAQDKRVANRFFNMPSARNRILGLQLYKFKFAGFLHWGYNFWYSQYSLRPIDPFRVTDAELAFPSGDAFLVYPGPEGPIESIRMEVFAEALQDLRALQLLETMIGRDAVLALMEEGLEEEITLERYPRDAYWLLDCRERINREIRQAVGSS